MFDWNILSASLTSYGPSYSFLTVILGSGGGSREEGSERPSDATVKPAPATYEDEGTCATRSPPPADQI